MSFYTSYYRIPKNQITVQNSFSTFGYFEVKKNDLGNLIRQVEKDEETSLSIRGDLPTPYKEDLNWDWYHSDGITIDAYNFYEDAIRFLRLSDQSLALLIDPNPIYSNISKMVDLLEKSDYMRKQSKLDEYEFSDLKKFRDLLKNAVENEEYIHIAADI